MIFFATMFSTYTVLHGTWLLFNNTCHAIEEVMTIAWIRKLACLAHNPNLGGAHEYHNLYRRKRNGPQINDH